MQEDCVFLLSRRCRTENESYGLVSCKRENETPHDQIEKNMEELLDGGRLICGSSSHSGDVGAAETACLETGPTCRREPMPLPFTVTAVDTPPRPETIDRESPLTAIFYRRAPVEFRWRRHYSQPVATR